MKEKPSIDGNTHARSDIAAWFIEGGTASLSKLSEQERD